MDIQNEKNHKNADGGHKAKVDNSKLLHTC
jgi:hypothetical protein